MEDDRVLVGVVEEVEPRRGKRLEFRPRTEVELVVDGAPLRVLVGEDLTLAVRRGVIDRVLNNDLDVEIGELVALRPRRGADEVGAQRPCTVYVRTDKFPRAIDQFRLPD
jgi:hypothetical protein